MPIHEAAAAILCAVLAALALLHFYWAVGGRLALQGAVPSADGRPLFEPGPWASLAVGVALASAAVLCALRGGLVALEVPPALLRLGTLALVLTFAARAIGDFRYVGFFKRVRGTAFARRDSLLYSPLCVLIAVLAAALAALAP